MIRNTITAWSMDDRPREKLTLKGRGVLSDAELLAIILGTGSGTKSAVDLARELLQLCCGDLHAFGKLQLSDLTKIKGVGKAKATSILAAFELGRRRKEKPSDNRGRIISSVQTYELLYPYYADLLHEEFYIILMSRRNKVIGIKRISVGGFTGTYVDSKVIFKTALEMQAAGIILSHNHPSGNLRPSEQDERLTRELVEFGKMIELPILDHLIITDNGYFSFADKGCL